MNGININSKVLLVFSFTILITFVLSDVGTHIKAQDNDNTEIQNELVSQTETEILPIQETNTQEKHDIEGFIQSFIDEGYNLQPSSLEEAKARHQNSKYSDNESTSENVEIIDSYIARYEDEILYLDIAKENGEYIVLAYVDDEEGSGYTSSRSKKRGIGNLIYFGIVAIIFVAGIIWKVIKNTKNKVTNKNYTDDNSTNQDTTKESIEDDSNKDNSQ